MTTQHFFLTSAPRTPTPRWLAAFGQGQVVLPAQLAALIGGLPANQFIVWLTSDDGQWRDMLKQAVQANASARVVLMSGSPEPAEGLTALDAGALGYTHSYALPEVLNEVATVVSLGGLWAGPDLLKQLVASTTAALAKLPQPTNGPGVIAQKNAKAWATLSAREAQVACSVSEGKSNKEVADELFVSERTIKAHLGSAFEKLGVRDRLQLALLVATIDPAARVIKDAAA